MRARQSVSLPEDMWVISSPATETCRRWDVEAAEQIEQRSLSEPLGP